MRKLLTLGAAVALTGVLLTGCMQLNGNINVSSTGSGSFTAKIDIAKDITDTAYSKMSEANGESLTASEVEAALTQSGFTIVNIDGTNYYEMGSETATDDTNFASIAEFYSNASTLVSAITTDENNSLSLSETSAELTVPANGDVLANLSSNSGAYAGIGDTSDMMEELNSYGLTDDVLKTAKMTYVVTFDTAITQTSDNAVLSNNNKTVTFTVPLINDTDVDVYAYCENDIAASGAKSGMLYNHDVNVTLPDGVTATVNGDTVSGSTVSCTNTGIYNINMKTTDGTSETLYFLIDKTSPASKSIKTNGCYNKKHSVVVYDEMSGISDIQIDNTSVMDYTTLDDMKSTTENSQGYYLTYKYSFSKLSAGTHTLKVIDKAGNESTCKFTIDNTAPVVKGVKNGKTYNKAVTLKFSDNKTVNKATLNGKTVKSGKKISKKGNYTLKVTDVAGNKTVVKFKIK